MFAKTFISPKVDQIRGDGRSQRLWDKFVTFKASSQRLGEEATTDRNKPNQVADSIYKS